MCATEDAPFDSVARLNAHLESRYTIGREVGSGGMAIVNLAQDLKHQRNVAVKMLRPDLAATMGGRRNLPRPIHLRRPERQPRPLVALAVEVSLRPVADPFREDRQ